MPTPNEQDRSGNQLLHSSTEKMAQAETDRALQEAVQTEVMHDLHSAVALTVRHCHHRRHNNRLLCRYLE
jgi:hypothetical protein